MLNRSKVMALAVVVFLGVGAAVVFRKEPAADNVEPSAAEQPLATVAAPNDMHPAFEKPAPASHLTGRIEIPAGGAAAADASGGSFGIAVSPPGMSPYSTIPPVRNSAAAPAADRGAGAGGPAGLTVSELRRHRIADGDTLSSLALRYLGSASRFEEIHALNRDVLGDNANLLPIGRELKIPAAGPAQALSPPPSTSVGASAPMVPVAPRQSSGAPGF